MRTATLFLALLAVGCDETAGTDAGPAPGDGGPVTDAGPPPPSLPTTLGPADRPAELVVPNAYDGTTALPVLVLLHGYSVNSAVQDVYFGVSRQTRRSGFYLILPEGTVDRRGNQFWNAMPGCCNFDGSAVDDSAYLIGLVDELESMAPVSDVFVLGHSNGGFMSYRMACDHADRVSAIVSLAGSGYPTDAECGATQPVSVLQIHGTLDATIPYGGGPGGIYASAPDQVARWAARAGCTDTPTSAAPRDLDSSLDGEESTVDRYVDGCTGAQAELWSIVGGGHRPAVSRSFVVQVLDWLEAQSR